MAQKTSDRRRQKYLCSHTGTHKNCKYLLVADKRSTFSDCYLRVFNFLPSLTSQMFIHVGQDENRWLGLKGFHHWKKKYLLCCSFKKIFSISRPAGERAISFTAGATKSKNPNNHVRINRVNSQRVKNPRQNSKFLTWRDFKGQSLYFPAPDQTSKCGGYRKAYLRLALWFELCTQGGNIFETDIQSTVIQMNKKHSDAQANNINFFFCEFTLKSFCFSYQAHSLHHPLRNSVWAVNKTFSAVQCILSAIHWLIRFYKHWALWISVSQFGWPCDRTIL